MGVRVTACVVWWDENPIEIRQMIQSLVGTVDSLVALDGAYARFPDATAASDAKQAEAFASTCGEYGIEFLLHQPREVGRFALGHAGEEIAKRNASLDLCRVFEPDWVIVVDPDMRMEPCLGLRDLLEWTDKRVVVDQVEDVGDHRHIFRWTPTLRYFRAHYVVVDGAVTLAAPPVKSPLTEKLGPLAEPLDLRDILYFTHEPKMDFWRRARANAYYKTRDLLGIESLEVVGEHADMESGDDETETPVSQPQEENR